MHKPVGLRYGTFALLCLALLAFTYRLGAMPLLDDPNEAEYAEVAREMIATGEWITPQLNYVVFLNKPPLTYWLIALSDLAFGTNEFAARLPGALAAVLVVLFVVHIGSRVYDAETGLVAGFLLLAMVGFLVETHEVRPDLMLTAGIVGSLAAFVRLRQVPAEKRWRALLALQTALAVGVLAKGLVGLILPAFIIFIVLIAEGRFDLLRPLLQPRSWWLFLLFVVPWHALVAIKHAGFLWDYFINQHLLFFFDRKLPHDSEPVSLAVFWATFALRLFPWTVFAPLALATAAGRIRRGAAPQGDRLLVTWALVVLLFFSAALARMEHYSIPVLPAFALLLAKLFRDYARAGVSALRMTTTGHVMALAGVAMIGPAALPWLVRGNTWLSPMGDLTALARVTSGIFAACALIAAAAALAQRRSWVVPALVSGVLIAVPFLHNGLALVARTNSSAGMAAAVGALADADDTVVYATPIEYQTCAGLTFYLRRKLTLLQPTGYVPPTYLIPHLGELFISQEQLDQLWRERRVFLLTDPRAPRAHLAGTVPDPFYVVARVRDWWTITNFPLH